MKFKVANWCRYFRPFYCGHAIVKQVAEKNSFNRK